MAVPAATGLDRVQPALPRIESDGDAVALVAGAREAASVGDPDHRRPINRRVILCRGGEAGSDLGGQVQNLARLAHHLWRVDQAVAAHPDPVGSFWEIRYDKAAAFVGDRHLSEAGPEIAGLCNDPDTGFRPEAAGDDAADVVIVDSYPWRSGRCR